MARAGRSPDAAIDIWQTNAAGLYDLQAARRRR